MRGCHLEIHLTKSFLHGRFGWRLCLGLTLFISSPVALWAQQQLANQNDGAALTAAYRGFVMDADDLPVSGVLVTSEASSKAERGELRHVREAQTRTDEFGRFELAGLRPIEMKDGARQLYFEHPDYGLAWYGRTYRDELTDTHDGLIHIQLQPGVELGGKVVLDEDGSPISGAIVSADVTYVFGSEEEAMLPARYHGLHVLTERYGRSVVTDAAGRFRLPKLPGGARLSLTVQHPGFVAYRSDQTQSAYPVSVRENSIDVELKPAVTIRGRLLADSKPIGMAGVQVSAVDRSRGQLAARTKTDNQGRFELTGLDENEYLLQTSAFTEQRKGLIGTPIAVEQRAAGSSISVDLDCTPGQVVTGMITDNQGRPAAGFGVFVRDIERLKDPKAEMIATADAEGRYRLRLAPGNYALSTRDWNRGKPRNDEHVVKILESGPNVALDFRISIIPEKLTGKLVDDHGRPLAGFIYSRNSPVATPKEDGAFTVGEYGPAKSEYCAVNRDKTLLRMFLWSGLKDDFPEQIVLSPAAKVVGRLIGEDVDGLSREDLKVACGIPVDRPRRGQRIHGLNRALWQLELQADGRFEFTVPVGIGFLFYGSHPRGKFSRPLFTADDLQPGELRDVGEVRYPARDVP